jgi:hypothetical protein
MQRTKRVILCAVCFVLGVCLTRMYINFSSAPNGERWIKLSAEPLNGTGDIVTYSSDALFRSDIKLPEVTSLTGKAKFVKDASQNAIKLGYVVDADIRALDKSKIPEQYQNPPAPEAGAASTKASIDSVYYDVVFYLS